MLSLYKNPDGEGVFSARDDPGQVTTAHGIQGGPPAQKSDIQEENDSLRKRVKQLEDAIMEYQVMLFFSTLTIMLVYIVSSRRI